MRCATRDRCRSRAALSHSPQSPAQCRRGGRPSRRLCRVSAARKAGHVTIDIADDGTGHSRGRGAARLFQPFASAARPGGTGLGLAISRDLARAHGGDVTLVETGPDGTRFRIDIPDRDCADHGLGSEDLSEIRRRAHAAGRRIAGARRCGSASARCRSGLRAGQFDGAAGRALAEAQIEGVDIPRARCWRTRANRA